MKKEKNTPFAAFSLNVVCLLGILFFGLAGNLLAQTGPEMETVLTLNPGEDNPRNSEGDFLTLKDGRIMFVYSRYTGASSSDHAPGYLAARYSANGGKTWTDKDEVVVEKEGTMNVMSATLLRLKNGKIALFYLKKNSISDCIPMVRFSSDEAKTWTDPITCITDVKGYFVLNNSRVIQLKSGRILMAVSLHQTPQTKWSTGGTLWSYYSDDNGKTWKSGQQVANPGRVMMQEPGVVELKNGNIMMYMRTNAGVQYLSYSKDKGQTWSPAEPSTIKSPRSAASIVRIPSTGDLMLVWNNNGGDDPLIKGKRTPLNVAISKDEGKTWQDAKTVEDDPNGWYCYPAIHFSGKHVLLGYCSGVQPKFKRLTVTDIKRISLDWIYGK